MSKRKQSTAELAAQISNDIAEGIDNGETRKELREAVAHFANLAFEETKKREAAELELKYLKRKNQMLEWWNIKA
jgi:hypothetical protein